MATHGPGVDRDDILSGGVRLIPIATAHGTFRVWTKRVGSHPSAKVLLLHGGPGATHEYFEAFDSWLPGAGIEYYYYDQLGSAYSDQPDIDDEAGRRQLGRLEIAGDAGRHAAPLHRELRAGGIGVVDEGEQHLQGEDAAARGPAAALATWVDVPPTDPAGVTRSRSVHPATARPSPVMFIPWPTPSRRAARSQSWRGFLPGSARRPLTPSTAPSLAR